MVVRKPLDLPPGVTHAALRRKTQPGTPLLTQFGIHQPEDEPGPDTVRLRDIWSFPRGTPDVQSVSKRTNEHVAKSAGVFVFATLISTGIAPAADQIQVKVKSILPETFIVDFSGGISLKDHEVPSGGSELPLAKASDGATITWVGKPKKPDESKYAECKGSATEPAMTLKGDHCKDKTAAAAPKTEPKKEAPKATAINFVLTFLSLALTSTAPCIGSGMEMLP